MTADSPALGTLTTVAMFLYFVALDLVVGAAAMALNATVRATPAHLRLRARLARMLPLAFFATVVLGTAALTVIRARAGGHGILPAGSERGATMAPYVHVVCAGLAVTGLWVAQAGLRVARRDLDAGRWLSRHGAIWALLATGVNLFAGAWWLVRLPQEQSIRFTGANLADMITFAVGVVAALLSLGFVGMAATERRPAAYLHAATVGFAVTLAAMVRMRETLRPPAATVEIAWLPLVGAMALVAGGVFVLVRAWRAFGGTGQ